MRLALTDPLTGLGNHRHFHERLQRELTQAEHDGLTLSLCLVDIDDFKRVNDRYGHPVGDRVLGQVASRLRQGGESFRLGGDEFAVLLPGLDERAAISVARSIVERVSGFEIEQVGAITVSAGVAAYPAQGVGTRRADPARRQRALLGEGRRQEPRRAPIRPQRRSSSRSCSSSSRGPTAPRATARRRASRRPSTRVTSTPAAIRSASASSRRGSRGGSASTSRRSS